MKSTIKILFLFASIALVQLSSFAAEEKEPRKVLLMSPHVGKQVEKAFDLYNVDDIKGALAIFLDINTDDSEFDKASVSRYIGVMYASDGKEGKGIDYLKAAIAPDILNKNDHAGAIKLLADLQMATEDYNSALANYYVWMEFTGKSDGQVWIKVAQAHFQLKQLDKVISPADKAIVAFGDKQNQNPYVLKIQSYYERKMYQDAIKVLKTTLQVFPENKTWWIQLGMFYLLVEDNSSALAVLELAYKQDFLEKEQHIKTLASLYSSNELPYKAAVLLEKHIDSGLLKKDLRNLAALANAWHTASHIDKAAKYYGDVAKLSNESKYYRRQGTLLKQDEQYKASITALNKALDLGVERGEGRIQMDIAESYFYMGQYKQAYVAIKEAMKDPKARKSAKGWKAYIEETAKRKKKII